MSSRLTFTPFCVFLVPSCECCNIRGESEQVSTEGGGQVFEEAKANSACLISAYFDNQVMWITFWG